MATSPPRTSAGPQSDDEQPELAGSVALRDLRATLDDIPVSIVIHSASGELEFENRIAHEYHGIRSRDAHEAAANTVHPDDLPALIAAQEHAFATGEPLEFEMRLRRADGAYRWFQMRSRRATDEDGVSRWYTVGTDVHDRKTAEAALFESERKSRLVVEESEQRWRAVFENSAIGVALADLHGRFLATNSAFQKMLGYTQAELSELSFVQLTHEDYRESNWLLVKELLEGRRKQFQIEKQYRRKDGSLVWVSNNVSLVPGTTSMPKFLMALSEDTTERKRTEETLRSTLGELARVTRVASLGEMTASIAHEVNQPLAAVVANGHACLRWLSASPPNVEKAAEAAERIVHSGKDAGKVVHRVRALFKRTTVERVPLDLSAVIEEVRRLLDGYPARKHVALDVALDPRLPPVFADRVQLQQLLLNLMVNALEALEMVSDRPKQLSVRSLRSESDNAVIHVSDNGIGLDDLVAAFEPFVTTKPEGMGLGLAICRSIVAAHEGSLSAERNAGFGMTFTVTLPIRPAGAP